MMIEYKYVNTGGFMKKVLSVCTHSMMTIYLSLSAQVAISTLFMKSPLAQVQGEQLVIHFFQIFCYFFCFKQLLLVKYIKLEPTWQGKKMICNNAVGASSR